MVAPSQFQPPLGASSCRQRYTARGEASAAVDDARTRSRNGKAQAIPTATGRRMKTASGSTWCSGLTGESRLAYPCFGPLTKCRLLLPADRAEAVTSEQRVEDAQRAA